MQAKLERRRRHRLEQEEQDARGVEKDAGGFNRVPHPENIPPPSEPAPIDPRRPSSPSPVVGAIPRNNVVLAERNAISANRKDLPDAQQPDGKFDMRAGAVEQKGWRNSTKSFFTYHLFLSVFAENLI